MGPVIAQHHRKMIKRIIFSILIILLQYAVCFAEQRTNLYLETLDQLPSLVMNGSMAYVNSTNKQYKFNGTWEEFGSKGDKGDIDFPSGFTVLLLSGSCPEGWSEVIGIENKTILFTNTSNGDVGMIGGNNTITPLGSVSQPTFVGNALATHQHMLPFQIRSSTLIGWINPTTWGNGTSTAAIGRQNTTANTTSFPVALSNATSGGTPTGNVSQPTYTGTPFDNRQEYVKVICCQKD